MPRNPFRDAVLTPNLGLYLDRPLLSIPARGLSACNNVRLNQGSLSSFNVGWTRWDSYTLNGRVLLIANWFLRSGTQLLIYGTKKDLYNYSSGAQTVAFLTPIYATGTIEVQAGTPTILRGSGTTWSSNLKAGDEVSLGSATETDPTATWYVIDTVDNNTQCTATTAMATTGAGASYTGRKLFTGDDEDFWVTEPFADDQPDNEDKLYLTNGVDNLMQWDGSDAQVVDQSGLGITKIKTMRAFKNSMLFFDYVVSGERRPTAMRKSNTGEPTEVATGDSAEFVIHDGTDPIQAAEIMGDFLAILSHDRDNAHIIMAQFVGDPLEYVFRDAVVGKGPIARRAVANHGDFLEFIGDDALYRFDGVNLSESGRQIWREVLRTASPNRADITFHHWDYERAELHWVVPLTTDATPTTGPPEKTHVEYYNERVPRDAEVPYLIRDLPATAMGYFERQTALTWDQLTDSWDEYSFRWDDNFFEAAFPFVLFGTADGKIYTLNTADVQDTTALTSFARFPRQVAVDGRHKGLLKRLYPFATTLEGAGYNLTCVVYTADSPAGTRTNAGSFSYDLAQASGSNRFVSPFVTGRFFEFEFGTTGGTNRPWSIGGYDKDVLAGGER